MGSSYIQLHRKNDILFQIKRNIPLCINNNRLEMIQVKIYELISNSGKSKTIETFIENTEWQGFGRSIRINKEQVLFDVPISKDLNHSRQTQIKYREATNEEIKVFEKFHKDSLESDLELEIEYNKKEKEKENFGNKEILGFKIKDICEKVSNEFRQKGKVEGSEDLSLESYLSVEIVSVFLNLYLNIPIKWIKNIPRLENAIFVADILDRNKKFIIINGEIRYKLQILLEQKLDPENIFVYNFTLDTFN